MPPIVSEDMPNDPASPTGDADFGQVSQTKQLTKDMQSNSGPAQDPGAPPQQGQPPPPQPQGPPPSVTPVQPQPVDARLDPSAVFDKPKAGQPPPQAWRDQLRQWAQHPQAGWGLQMLADAVKNQRGPLDKHK
jgi:hypothetical protein